MKTTDNKFNSKRSFSRMMWIACISFCVFALALSCEEPKGESEVNQDSIDSVKSVQMKMIDTTGLKDTAKSVDAGSAKP